MTATLWAPRRTFIAQRKHNETSTFVDNEKTEHQTRIGVNEEGRVYRKEMRLFPSGEALERAATRRAFGPAERLPPTLLPSVVKTMLVEGDAAEALAEEEAAENAAAAAAAQSESSTAPAPVGATTTTTAARERLARDLGTNAARREDPAKGDEGVSWRAIPHLDPLLAQAAIARVGETATPVQARLLPALLHEAHRDLIFNAVTGSGKTVAMALAMLQGVRNETTGMNIFVAANDVTAQAFGQTMRWLCGPTLGGEMVDRAHDDFSWLHVALTHDDPQKHRGILRKSLQRPQGPVRCLVTTPVQLCELIFHFKFEFQDFGNVRRIFVDDTAAQIPLLDPLTATAADEMERIRHPHAAELLLATFHQLLPPHTRSLMQLACVSADLEPPLKDHLKALCIKEHAHSVILAPPRLPSNLHCMFSFHDWREATDAATVRILRRLSSSPAPGGVGGSLVPGRVVIFVPQETNLLEARAQYRRLGMDAKLLFEVADVLEDANGIAPPTKKRLLADPDGAGNASDAAPASTSTSATMWRADVPWKFLLMHENEAFGVDIPGLSHVVVTFPPANRHSYVHMAGRAGRLGAPGWVLTVTGAPRMQEVTAVVGELDVDVVKHTLDGHTLAQVPPRDVERIVAPPTPWGLDPQEHVARRYELFDVGDDRPTDTGMFGTPATERHKNSVIWEDPTPVAVLETQRRNSFKLMTEVRRDPARLWSMARNGYLTKTMQPTPKLVELMRTPDGKKGRGRDDKPVDFSRPRR